MSIQPKFDSPLADYLDGAGDSISGGAQSRRHAVMAYIDACDKFANGFDPYEYMDVESTYGFLPYSQVDAASTIREFVEDERAASSDAGFRIDTIIEDYAYGYGYDEPELLVAEMNRGLHKDVWTPLIPVVESAFELKQQFDIDTQYLNFEERPNLARILESSRAHDAVPSVAEYVSKHSSESDYINEELLVDISMTESKLLAEPTAHDAMFTAEEQKCFSVVEDFGKGFTSEGQKPAFKAHFDELYRDALLGAGEVTAQDVVHISNLQDEIREQSPYEIDTLSMLEQMSPNIQLGIPHYLLDALEPQGRASDGFSRAEIVSALGNEDNLIVDYEHGIAMMSDIEDQSVTGFVLGKETMVDVLRQAPNNQTTRSLFYGEIANNAQASFSTWDTGFPMVADKFAEQGMTHMFYGSNVSALRHELKSMTASVEESRAKTDMSNLDVSHDGAFEQQMDV